MLVKNATRPSANGEPGPLSALPSLQVSKNENECDNDVEAACDGSHDNPVTDLGHGHSTDGSRTNTGHPLQRAITYSGSKISYVDILAPHGRKKRAVGGVLSICAVVIILVYGLAKIIYLLTDPQLTVSSAVLETGGKPLPMCV